MDKITAYEINSNGIIVDYHVININDETDYITVQPQGLYKPMWNGQKWTERATPSEIEEINGDTLELLKNTKINLLNDACNKTVLGRFKATIGEVEFEFSYDYDAQLRFTGIGVMFNAGKLNEIEWTAYKNNERVRITLNQANFDTVTLAALYHQNYNVTKFNQLLQQVNGATTKEQIEAIVW